MLRIVPALVVITLLLAGCAHLNRADPLSTAPEVGRAPARASDPSSLSAELLVATFNVYMASAGEIVLALSSDRQLRRADVILLQEIEASGEGPSEAAHVAAKLGYHHAYAPGYGLPGGGSHGIAILSRYPLSDIEVVELPRHSTVVNSARRVALGVTVHAREPVRVWNVHLDNRINPADRVAQLSAALDAADASPISSQIVAGDLNTSPFCWVGRLLPVPCGLQTTRVETELRRRGYELPTRASGATSRHLGMRLDVIVVRGLEGVDVGVSHADISDHYPLWATLRIASR